MSESSNVVIVGAGPNGLSLAAHLAHRGVEHRIFGSPLQHWLTQMPKGMMLKSDGFASNLYDSRGDYPLRRFCAEAGRPYADLGLPVTLDTFTDYGLAFQQRFAPALENRRVVQLGRSASGFTVRLDNGEALSARRVVVASGLSHFSNVPPELRHLPPELASHSSAHRDLARFRNTDVAVVGGGSSAIDLAGLLHQVGARVCLIARRPRLDIHTRMRLPRPLRDRLRNPNSVLGPSWRSWFYANCALAFHYFPEERRLRTVRRQLGPAAGWFMADLVAPVPLLLGYTLQRAAAAGSRVELHLASNEGAARSVTVDHVIAATGFKPDLRRLEFLDPLLLSQVATRAETPVLSSHFESSVPGLYFCGPISANSFGPLVRFAVGAKFTASRIAPHLARKRTRRSTIEAQRTEARSSADTLVKA